jgi:hypothetical protein
MFCGTKINVYFCYMSLSLRKDMVNMLYGKHITLNESYRKERERYLINKFNTYYKGINRMP